MKKLMLVLEDDAAWQMSIKLTVRKTFPDAELVLIDNGQGCVRRLEAMPDPPSICILDINLPGDLSGLDVLERLRSDSKYRNLPIIMFSTSDSEMDKSRANLLGATEYVVKPPIAQMKRVLSQLVEKYVPSDDVNEFPDLSNFL